jgi:hypothetical protein
MKRKKLDKYIVCKDAVLPISSTAGRPQDDTLDLIMKIKQKSIE